MSFTYSVIGDNTIENREHLEKLGYTPLRFCLNGKYLYARSCTWANKNRTWQEPYFATDNNIDNSPKYINCIGNPQLFKAVSAMRDDSDKHQYFVAHCFIEFFPMKDQSDRKTVAAGQFFLCKKDNIKSIKAKWLSFHCVDELYHKATLSELQAHSPNRRYTVEGRGNTI